MIQTMKMYAETYCEGLDGGLMMNCAVTEVDGKPIFGARCLISMFDVNLDSADPLTFKGPGRIYAWQRGTGTIFNDYNFDGLYVVQQEQGGVTENDGQPRLYIVELNGNGVEPNGANPDGSLKGQRYVLNTVHRSFDPATRLVRLELEIGNRSPVV